jgi:hypothetical protein
VLTSILTVCRVGQLLLFDSNSPKSFFICSFESGLLIGCRWFEVGWWWPPAYSLSLN